MPDHAGAPSPAPGGGRLYLQVLVAIALGALFGYLAPTQAIALKPLGDAFIALVKMLIENDKVSVETYRKDVEAAYAGYLDRLAKFDEAKQSLKRFDNSTAIGIVPDGNNNWFYIIADASDSPSVDALTNWKRYNTLYNSPLAADAAMIRTYMEGRMKTGENELKLPFEDKFYPDIDISVGYSSTQHGLWVLIPKNDVPALT